MMVIRLTKLLLDKKHQFSRIWLAAHWEKKVKRTQISEFDIVKSVQDIMETELILDLRISSHLLVGIVKIHSRKVKYFLTECSSIFNQVKIYQVNRIDLPENMQTASLNDITLNEFFSENFENCGGDLIDAILKSNQSQLEDITLKETSEKLTLLGDDDEFIYHEEDEPFINAGDNAMSICNDFEISNAEMTKNIVNAELTKALVHIKVSEAKICIMEKRLDPLCKLTDQDEFDMGIFSSDNLVNEIPESIDMSHITNRDADPFQANDFNSSHIPKNNKTVDKLELEPARFINNNKTKNKKTRKRKLCIDYIKCMSRETIKKQVLDTSDIMSVLDVAPSTKRLMKLKQIGSAETLLSLPGLNIMNSKLLQIYQRHLKTQPCENSESPTEDFSQNLHQRRKISMSQSFSINEVSEDSAKCFDEEPVPDIGNGVDINREIFNEGAPVNPGTEEMVDIFEQEACETLLPEIPLADILDRKDLQSTPISQERWKYALQGRIIQMLEHLKQLFTEKHVIHFSYLSKNYRKLQVAQKFFCLMMLKKFQVISLKQTEAYGEIFISKDINFDAACSNFCSI